MACSRSHTTAASPPSQNSLCKGLREHFTAKARSMLLSPSHRTTAQQGLAGPSVGHPAQPPAQAGSPGAGCTAPHPGRLWISPEKETPQPLWVACSSALSPSHWRSSSSCSAGTSSASFCTHCPLSCCWTPLRSHTAPAHENSSPPKPPSRHRAAVNRAKEALWVPRGNSKTYQPKLQQHRASTARGAGAEAGAGCFIWSPRHTPPPTAAFPGLSQPGNSLQLTWASSQLISREG